MMTKAEPVPLGRILKFLPIDGSWVDPAFQGPNGCYAVRVTVPELDDPPMFQVSKVERRWIKGAEIREVDTTEDVSEPFLTFEGARQFAERIAGTGSEITRF